jgi:hypothetical protein
MRSLLMRRFEFVVLALVLLAWWVYAVGIRMILLLNLLRTLDPTWLLHPFDIIYVFVVLLYDEVELYFIHHFIIRDVFDGGSLLLLNENSVHVADRRLAILS